MSLFLPPVWAQEQKKQEHASTKAMSEALDIFGAPRRALAAVKRLFASFFKADFFPLNDLPNDVLVSVFAATEDPTWVRHTVPLVCKAWNELYLSQNASPLHETLEVDFAKEVDRVAAAVAAREEEGRRDPVEGAPRGPVVHASRVISWAQGRADWVRKLRLVRGLVFSIEGIRHGNFEHFTAEDLGALVAVVGSSLTKISIGYGLDKLCEGPFWESLRASVVPAGRLRSFGVGNIDDASFRSDVETLLGQLAGSLEELGLQTRYTGEYGEFPDPDVGLQHLPESLFALEKLRRLFLDGHPRLTAIPAGISSLKNLEELELGFCDLSSLPKELGELSRLTMLNLPDNPNLGTTLHVDEAFPAELSKLKSLRELDLRKCGLGTVPASVCKLKSLESLSLEFNHLSSLPKELGELSRLTMLDLWDNRELGLAPEAEAFPAELGKMKSLRHLRLSSCGLRTVPAFVGKLESLESLDLEGNFDLEINAPLDFLIEGSPRLREVRLSKGRGIWTPESQAHLEAFEAKLRARNPDAEVSF